MLFCDENGMKHMDAHWTNKVMWLHVKKGLPQEDCCRHIRQGIIGHWYTFFSVPPATAGSTRESFSMKEKLLASCSRHPCWRLPPTVTAMGKQSLKTKIFKIKLLVLLNPTGFFLRYLSTTGPDRKEIPLIANARPRSALFELPLKLKFDVSTSKVYLEE